MKPPSAQVIAQHLVQAGVRPFSDKKVRNLLNSLPFHISSKDWFIMLPMVKGKQICPIAISPFAFSLARYQGDRQ